MGGDTREGGEVKWAEIKGNRIEASPSQTAACPNCGGKVRSKCGHIKIWHWAHAAKDCDPWSEPETEWHRGWKDKFPKEWQEVRIGKHRADIKTPTCIIELQSDSLSPEEIAEREEFYGEMVWIVNGEDFWENLKLRRKRESEDVFTFRWKHPRKSWRFATRPLIFDLPLGYLNMKKIYWDGYCGGWGVGMTEVELMEMVGAFE